VTHRAAGYSPGPSPEPHRPRAPEASPYPPDWSGRSDRCVRTIPAEGWSAFLGPYKDVQEGEGLQRVSVNFADIRNLTVDACKNQRALDPPVGPTVNDLAAALAALPPFEVTSPPSDVTAFGYSGKHVEIRVPLDQPIDDVTGSADFAGCQSFTLRTWIAPPLSFAFYGYTAPGDTEEFWILDVDGARIVIAALRTANASADMLAEQQAVLGSIVIQP
jgi:hypothetical protein